MDKANHDARLNFLRLKMKTGMTLTPNERAEFDRLKGIIITEIPHGVLYVSAPPMSTAEWKETVAALPKSQR